MNPLQSTNNKVLAIEEYVKNHVKTTVLGVLLFFVLVFYALKYVYPQASWAGTDIPCRFCFDSDLPTPNDYYVAGLEKKGRGRLD